MLDPLLINSINWIGALSKNDKNGNLNLCPFDKLRDGILLGEAASIMIIESVDNCIKNKWEYLAEILSFGLTGDGNHMV